MHGAYRNRVYSSVFPESGNFEATLDKSNVARLYMEGTLVNEMVVSLSHNDHLIKQDDYEIGYLSTDGEMLLLYVDGTEIPLALSDATPPVETYVAGLYDISGNLIASWDTLVSKHGLDVSKDYDVTDITGAQAEPTLLYNIIKNNPEYANTYHVKVSNSVKNIGALALTMGDLENVKWITIPEVVERIGDGAVASSTNLLAVTIPSTVKSVGAAVFMLSGVTTVNIPANVENLAAGFGIWSNIKTLTVDGNNPYYKSINNAVYTKDGKKLLQGACGRNEAFVVQEGTETICESALAFSDYISVNIPASVITIEDNAMEEMTKLVEVTFAPNSKLKTIGKALFIYSGDIPTLEIPEGVTEIKDDTFTGTSIKTLTLPSTITSISLGYDWYVDRLVLKSATPPTLPDGIRLYSATDPNGTPTIVVPKGKGEIYKTAAGWSECADYIVEATE